MKFSNYIAHKILNKGETKKNMSRPIVKISITGIALGVAVMIITMAVVTGFQKQIIQKIITFNAHLQISDYNQNKSDEPNPITFEDDFLQKISTRANLERYICFEFSK